MKKTLSGFLLFSCTAQWFETKLGREADNLRTKFIETFKSFGLKITVASNLKVVDYLDITMNLNTGMYHPYKKPGDHTTYINVDSNHPPPPTSSNGYLKRSTKVYQNSYPTNAHLTTLYPATMRPSKPVAAPRVGPWGAIPPVRISATRCPHSSPEVKWLDGRKSLIY
ncbi:hypothetical protein HOLleu_02777 [Holothuria leucospilota]|uniref:Uncharacterized protein n=1 Tax=Holothuria leucospilota TaxID=206669 RepID=A0A9Q1CSP2_HOLLE|nr:hypothetical protein HOLleu_02777 [Holothuria leucospilota]